MTITRFLPTFTAVQHKRPWFGPNMVNYGGGTRKYSIIRSDLTFALIDEVAALVVDIGASSVRAGYAGDDTPKAIIPTSYGYIPDGNTGDVAMADTADGKKPRFYIGQSGPSIWRHGMEIGNPIKDGLSTFGNLYQQSNCLI